MRGLMAHCGTALVSREELMECVPPEGTHTFRPIAHGTLLEEAEKAIQEAGMRVVVEDHALSPNRLRYFGVLQIQNGGGNGDYAMMIGLRNSNDKTFRAGLAAGAKVFVCDNLSFSGEVVVARKHTVHILDDLPGLIAGAVAKVKTLHVRQEERFAVYKDYQISTVVADCLMIDMLRQRIITCTQLPKVMEEWEKPSHEELLEGGLTAWRMFNAVTEILRPRSYGQLDALTRKTQGLHELMDNVVGVSA